MLGKAVGKKLVKQVVYGSIKRWMNKQDGFSPQKKLMQRRMQVYNPDLSFVEIVGDLSLETF